jgi:hypothetical protein
MTRRRTKRNKLGECELGCYDDSDCFRRHHKCSFQHKDELRQLGLSGHKAYCSNIDYTEGQYVCYSPKKTTWNMCTDTVLTFGNSRSCTTTNKQQATCYVHDKFICLRFIKRELPDGNYICRPRSCLYTMQGSCRVPSIDNDPNNINNWLWQYIMVPKYTLDESKCI